MQHHAFYSDGIYGDDLYRVLDANRRVAVAFLRRAEDTMDYVAESIDDRGVFDHVRYNYGQKNVTGAQAALSAGARRDRIRARGASGRQQPTSSVFGSLGGLISQAEADEVFEQALADVQQALRDAGDATVDAIVPFDVPDDLTSSIQDVAARYGQGLRTARDMEADIARMRVVHRDMLLRLRALYTIEGEIGSARESMAHVADEVEAYRDRLARIRRDMESATGRLELLGNTPQWIARLSFMRQRMEATIDPGTLRNLVDSSEQGILNEEYNEMIERVRDIGLDTQADLEALMDEGQTIARPILQMLAGRDEVPDGMVLRIRAWRQRLQASAVGMPGSNRRSGRCRRTITVPSRPSTASSTSAPPYWMG